MDEIATELALANRFDHITREAAAEQGLELDFERLALQLLRALFGLATEVLDLALHAGDLRLLLGDLGLEAILRLELRFVADCGELLLNLFLYAQLNLAPGVVELALLAQHGGLRLLGLGELFVVGSEHLAQVGQLLVPPAKLVGQRRPGLPCLGLDDCGALSLQSGRHLVVDRLPGLSQLLLGLSELGVAAGKVGLPGSQLRLELLARLGNQRCCERFRQLKFGAALGADDLGVCHGLGPGGIAWNCIGPWDRFCHLGRRYPRQSHGRQRQAL